MPVNFTGTYAAIRAFVPVLIANGGGHIRERLSLLSLASTPPMAGYSASKAAAHSLTQELRLVLAAQGISVHGVYPGGIDTDTTGLADDLEDILPDPNAEVMAGPPADRPEGVRARLLRRRRSLARR
jgi:NAD(P)-dependent dehydrogenase (short-subunit alcohol dehydrogenase family)